MRSTIISFICGMVFIALLFIAGCSGIDTGIEGHPFPDHQVVYVAADPDTNKPIIQIVGTKWGDGEYRESTIIKVLDEAGNTWVICCPSNDPSLCDIHRIGKDSSRTLISPKKVLETKRGEYFLELKEFNYEYKPTQ